MRKRTTGNRLAQCLAALVAVLGPVAIPASTARAQVIINPGFSNSYGDWSARWWQWLFAIPQPSNPNFAGVNADCARGQAGNVWFLGGSFGGEARRVCEARIPQGKALFFPLITAVAYGDKDLNSLRVMAGTLIDLVDVQKLYCAIDGQKLSIDFSNFRASSPTFSVLPPIYGSIVPPGLRRGPNPKDTLVADGYWLLVPPLSPGPHSITYGAMTTNGFVVGVSYEFTIKPPEVIKPPTAWSQP